MSSRTPPRHVPTLTQVVTPSGEPARVAAAPSLLSQEQLVERVLQRVDLTLDRRLREAIAATVLEQTRSIGPALREEIEAVVRVVVAQAFEAELSEGQQSPPR